MDIQNKLEQIKLFFYANYLSEKLDYTDKIKAKTSGTVVNKGLDIAREKKLALI